MSLKEEIRKRKPFDCIEEEVYLNLQRSADALRRGIEELLKEHSLSATQYNILRILRGAGREGLACREVGRRMITRDPDTTRLFERLEDRGLISRHRQRNDRRVIKTRITAAGLKIIAAIDEPLLQAHRAQLHHMGAEKLKRLSRLLEEARQFVAEKKIVRKSFAVLKS